MRYLEHRQTSISSHDSGTRCLPWGLAFLSHIWCVAVSISLFGPIVYSGLSPLFFGVGLLVTCIACVIYLENLRLFKLRHGDYLLPLRLPHSRSVIGLHVFLFSFDVLWTVGLTTSQLSQGQQTSSNSLFS
jgi:hypothetical protein